MPGKQSDFSGQWRRRFWRHPEGRDGGRRVKTRPLPVSWPASRCGCDPPPCARRQRKSVRGGVGHVRGHVLGHVPWHVPGQVPPIAPDNADASLPSSSALCVLAASTDNVSECLVLSVWRTLRVTHLSTRSVHLRRIYWIPQLTAANTDLKHSFFHTASAYTPIHVAQTTAGQSTLHVYLSTISRSRLLCNRNRNSHFAIAPLHEMHRSVTICTHPTRWPIRNATA